VGGVFVIALLAAAAAQGADDSFGADASKLFPVMEGWNPRGAPASFTPSNLYEFNDGEAEIYLLYGFKQVRICDYVNAQDAKRRLSAEIYKMGSPLEAFGIYSAYRGKRGKTVAVGAEGYQSSTQLLFYKGLIFGKLTTSDPREDAAKALLDCATKIAAVLPGDGAKPQELELLKTDVTVPGTEQYLMNEPLDLPCFKRVLLAEATLPSQAAPARLILVMTESSDDADRAAKAFEEYIKSAGGTAAWQAGASRPTLEANSDKLKHILLRRSGNRLAGICQLEKSDNGTALLDAWQNRLEGTPH
jgi:hypothetical protein